MQQQRPYSRTMMRRVVAPVAVAVTLALLVAACGPGPSNGDPTPTEGVRLTVTASGNGRVVSDAIDLNCSGTCTVTVPEGTDVSLAAAPGSGQVHAGWDGPCGPLAETCAWTASEDVDVTATFAPHALRFDLQGDGAGYFEIRGGGIDAECRDACFVALPQPLGLALTFFAEGTRTELGPWSGACADSGLAGYCLVQVAGGTTVGKTWLHPPIAADHDDYATDQETTLVVPTPQGVLRGVDDTPDDVHSASLVSGPAHGSLDLAASGGFTYTPNVGFAGDDTFTYRVTDAFGNTDEGDVSVTVRPRLTLTKSGSGSVTSDPEGIDCGPTCDEDLAHFALGTAVTLTAEPTLGNSFLGWVGGPCDGSDAPTCDVLLNAPTAIAAGFATSVYALSVGRSGIGTGNVTSTPAGIDLDAGQTSTDVTHGTTVTLTASPAANSQFNGWTGAPCAGESSNICTFTATADATVTADFTLKRFQLGVGRSGSGTGNVTSTPAGIDLDAGQTSTDVTHGTTVTLTASPADESAFSGWTAGPCLGTDTNPCEFDVVGDVSANAAFDALP